MSDLPELCQRRIIQEALRQENERAHYAKTGYGHMYDLDGRLIGEAPLRPGTAQFIGRRGPTQRQLDEVPAPGRAAMSIVRFAVTSFLDGSRRVCAGRCDVPTDLPVGDPDNQLQLSAPFIYSWRRPRQLPRDFQLIAGECCANRRHFDCLGFVSWCLWKALGPDFPQCLARFSVRDYQARSAPIPRTGPLLPGDLLFDTGLDHIGIVVSTTQVAHSAGFRWGVRRTLVNGPIYPAGTGSVTEGTGAWHSLAGRLTTEILQNLRSR